MKMIQDYERRLRNSMRTAINDARRRENRNAAKGHKPARITVTLEQVMMKLRKQNFRCAISGLQFWRDNAPPSRNGACFGPTCPSIDRIKADGDYSNANTRVVLLGVNGLRGRGSDRDMYRIARAIAARAAVVLLAITLIASPKPAEAHGGFWPGFAAGAITSLFVPRPYYGYGYGYGYGPPVVFAPPPVAWYPPGAPTVLVPTVQPDPVIRHVQAGLNALGFGPLNIDGLEGPSTYDAICRFQSVNGLVVDGVAGSGTLAVLDHQLAMIAPPPPPPVAEGGGK